MSAVLRATVSGWLLRDPEDRRQHGDVLATLRVPDASRSLSMAVLVHMVASSTTTKEALRALRRGDPATIMGRARCAEQAGRTPGFEQRILYVHADAVLVPGDATVMGDYGGTAGQAP